MKLAGIIYLHEITQRRMFGTAYNMLKIFTTMKLSGMLSSVLQSGTVLSWRKAKDVNKNFEIGIGGRWFIKGQSLCECTQTLLLPGRSSITF